jgi:hypothetical protein
LFFPYRELNESFPSLDRSEVLVPIVAGDMATLARYVAPPGAVFLSSENGVLRASQGDLHYLFVLER